MRRPNRNIEIFSMSVLDLFASALGAFIMIAVILFPSYLADQKLTAKLNEAEEIIEEKTKALENSNNALAEAAVLKAKLEEETEALRLEIARTFLIISIEWDTPGADIDLGVVDPQQNFYYFAKNNKSGRDFAPTLLPPSGTATPEAESAAGSTPPENAMWAELSFDNVTGPGLELWQSPLAEPGIYEIKYKLYASSGAPDAVVPVRGKIFYRNGRQELPVQPLSSQNREITIRVNVNEEGILEVL